MNGSIGTPFCRGLRPMRWALLPAVLILAALPCGASVVNGDFSAGLAGWTASGDVEAAADASLGDTGAIYSLLYQGVALAPGAYRVEFDLLNLLSEDVPVDPLAFPDALFASLYFIDNLAAFDPANAVFDDVESLMSLDASGPYDVSGTLSASGLGPEWMHFAYDFTNNFAYVIPLFELLDFNTITGDSEVRLDNVVISQRLPVVPEPGTLTLSLLGFMGYAVARRRRSTRRF